MCGICGIYNFTNKKINIRDKLIKMNKLLEHRGPDGNGIWINTTENIGLSHTRLSIIDLNNRSKQPMVFNNYVITFNGEIYNYDVLKKDLLSSWSFNTDSDTEVILALYHKYKDKCVDFLDGMFSFVIYNINTNVIFCARDRLGIKPFYYFIEDNVFYFASEIKALLPNLSKVEEDIEGISEYLIFQYPISEITMFKKIKQLLPSHILKINSEKTIKITKYWNLDYINKITDSEDTIKENIQKLFLESINNHVKSDVPITSYISGGIDSGLVSILTKKTGKLSSCFHGRFLDGDSYDESEYANIISNDIDINLNILDIDSNDFKKYIKQIIYHLDFPIVGPGAFPQFMVSKLVGKNNKVVLGGQGGDEIFSGYVRYIIPYFEKILNDSINGNSDELKDFLKEIVILKEYKPMLKNFFKNGMFQDLPNRYFEIIDRSKDLNDIINWNIIDKELIKDKYLKKFKNKHIPDEDFFNKMLDFDLKYSLPGLLHVEDRMSMAWHVESRVPIISHKLIEYVAKIPENNKVNKGNMKALLKETFKNEIPKKVLERKDKMGFPVPLNKWFNENLKKFIIELIINLKKRNISYLNITDSFIDNLTKNSKFDRKIWILISLELWYENFFSE